MMIATLLPCSERERFMKRRSRYLRHMQLTLPLVTEHDWFAPAL